MHVLVAAASRHGSTLEIGEAIAATLRRRGFDVIVATPSSVTDVERYDAVILGSAVYGGRWLEPAVQLVRRCADALRTRRVWLFSSGPVGDPERPIVQRMATASQPAELARACGARDHRVFGGKLAREDLSPLQRAALRVVGGLVGDWRPWTEIDDWASAIAEQLGHDEWVRRLGDETAGVAPAERRDRP